MPEFSRPRHRLVWQVLDALDRDFLSDAECWFAGGTRIVLEIDEYRESMDLDFLCASTAGYRAIRSAVTTTSLGPVFKVQPALLREIRADRYGVRTWLTIDDQPLKLEIVSEGRVPIYGGRDDRFPVDVLNHQSCFVEKLLANSDRGRDTTTLSRDLVDLAFMAAAWKHLDAAAAIAMAEDAYGTSIRRDLAFTLARFSDDKVRHHVLEALQITDEQRMNEGLSRLTTLL